jgi:hypothetical protein
MPSLNQIVSIISSRLDRPFDDMLKAEVKPLFINELSLLVRRSIDANGIDSVYLASFDVELILIEGTDNLNLQSDYKVLRSVNRVPIPVRYKTPVPFVYVGTVNGENSFGYSKEHESKNNKELPFIGNQITYDFVNQYIFVRNNTKLNIARVIAPYVNFNLITDNSIGSNGINYTDDMELPYPADLINAAVLSLLQGILGGLDSKDRVVATHLDNQ